MKKNIKKSHIRKGAIVQQYWILQEKIQNIFTYYEISEYEFKILEFLIGKNPLTIKAENICSGLSLDRGWTFRSLRKLEKLGYVSRINGWIHANPMSLVIRRRIEDCINATLIDKNSTNQ